MFGDDLLSSFANCMLAYKTLKELNRAKVDSDEIKSNSEDLIFEKFQAMRNKVDLIRERIIQKANECSDHIISDIDLYESECKRNLSQLDSKLESNGTAFHLARIKVDLREWEAKMTRINFEEALLREINDKTGEYSNRLENSAKKLKDEIFLGREKKLEFETKYANIFDTFCKHVGFNT
jgi:hypothetical protein